MDKITIRREWDDSVIKISVDEKEISITCSIDAFERRLCSLLLKHLPSLTWDFRAPTINEKVRSSFHDAFVQTTKEMKEETVKVISKQ